MHLTIVNKETKEEIDKCQSKEWLEAVQYVEQNKDKYKESGCTEIVILNKRSKLEVHWELIDELRPLILKDKSFDETKKSRVKFKSKSP
jgi:hypothetical protein